MKPITVALTVKHTRAAALNLWIATRLIALAGWLIGTLEVRR